MGPLFYMLFYKSGLYDIFSLNKFFKKKGGKGMAINYEQFNDGIRFSVRVILLRADDRKEWISLPIPSIGTPPELQDTQQWKVGVLLCM